MPDATSLRRRRLALVLGLILIGCGEGPAPIAPLPDTPGTIVDRALSSVVARDLATASTMVCVASRNPAALPFPISGYLAPVGAMPGYVPARTLAVIQLDASELSIGQVRRDAGSAEVRVSGVLVERFNPAEVEALFRAYSAEAGAEVDQTLLDETLANVGRGPVRLPVDENVKLILEGGAWRICPDPPVE